MEIRKFESLTIKDPRYPVTSTLYTSTLNVMFFHFVYIDLSLSLSLSVCK